jgi:hypothetical protein
LNIENAGADNRTNATNTGNYEVTQEEDKKSDKQGIKLPNQTV